MRNFRLHTTGVWYSLCVGMCARNIFYCCGLVRAPAPKMVPRAANEIFINVAQNSFFSSFKTTFIEKTIFKEDKEKNRFFGRKNYLKVPVSYSFDILKKFWVPFWEISIFQSQKILSKSLKIVFRWLEKILEISTKGFSL